MTGAIRERLRRSPAVSLVVVAHLYLLLFVLAAVVALAMPDHGVAAVDAGAAVAFRDAGGARVGVGRDQPVTVASRAGRLTMPALELVPDYMPSGERIGVARFFADRDRLAAIARAPDARLLLAGPRGTIALPLHDGRRTLADLPVDFWLLGIQAVAIGLLGWWLRLAAPPSTAATMFALSCDGILLTAMAGAVFDARALTADGTLLWTMQVVNLVGTNLCATGLMALFFYLPRALAPRWFGPAALLAAVLLGVAEGLGLIRLAWFYILLVVPNVALLCAAALQWRASRDDPGARAVIRLIGASTFAGAASICCGMVVPVLFDLPSFARDGFTIFPLALIYGTIAFGIAGTRLFVLDLWSYRLAVGAATVLLLLAADALIARVLQIGGSEALVIALLGVGYAYLPLRSRAWRWITGTETLSRETLVRQTALVAFAPDAQARHAGWRALLERVFAPLEIAPGGATPEVRIERSGELLHIPATPDSEALCLRYARGGTRLFSPADAEVGRELVSLVHEASAARSSYMVGVREERQRIARDLHDDVSGLLLSGLHRVEIDEVRDDVRQAMTEIRSMVSSLADGDRPLEDVLADIRHEAAVRLAAVGIELAWQLPPEPALHASLDYVRARTLTSSLRETVTNVIKHARASRLGVDVAFDGATLMLLVADDGGGAVPTIAPTGSGRGLPNIMRRIEEIGGHCRLEPCATGFRMRLTMPLTGDDRPNARPGR